MFLFLLSLLILSLFFQKDFKIKIPKILSFGVLATLILLPAIAFAQVTYTDLPVAPSDDLGTLITYIFSQGKIVMGQGTTAIIAFIITILIAITKFTFLKPIFDKLGNWKFIIPITLGAIAEILFNIPKPFTWTAFITILVQGITGIGAVSIAVHHVWDKFKGKK